MSFPRYPAYKPSGVEWLGEVPEHWSVERFKLSVRSCVNGVWGEEPGNGENDLICMRVADFDRLKLMAAEPGEPTIRSVSARDIEQRSLCNGDLLIEKSGGGEKQPVGAVVLYTGSTLSVCSNFVARMRLTQGMNPSFWRYAHHATYSLKVNTKSIKQTSGIQNLDQQQYLDERAPFPPGEEQVAIATFLDHETAKIDALTAEQQRLIELLQEKRQAVISHVVTKGLNPDVPMKDSGVEWLGEVPEHWTLNRLKHLSPNLTVGIVVNPSEYVSDEGLPFVYGGDIREGVIDWENSRRIAPALSDKQPKTRLQSGDLLMVRVGAPGITAVVPAQCEGGNCASVMLIRQGSFSSQWLCYALNTRIVRFQVEVVQYGAAQEQFNISHAVNFWLPVPPRQEQDRIAAFLDSEHEKAQDLIHQAHCTSTLKLRSSKNAAPP
jgi:type I restriction enzyme S subunit